MLKSINRFLRDTSGAFAPIWVFACVPVLASVAMAVDFSEISRLKYDLSNSTDATCSVVGRSYMAGQNRTEIDTIADKFFESNFDPKYSDYAEMTLVLPDDAGNTAKELKCKASLEYHPYFGPMMALFFGGDAGDYVTVITEATMKMKNVAEIALVLDNSGSMAYDKFGNNTSTTSNQRMTLLKTAAKKLVVDMIDLGTKIHQTVEPVKFSVVPFAASVNVGSANSTASWMDLRGISPIHHEHLDWGLPIATNPTGLRTIAADGAKLDAAGNPLTRFSILNALQVQTGGTAQSTQCEVWKSGSTSNGSSYGNCAIFRRTGTTAVSITSAAAASAINNGSYNQTWLNDKYKWKGCVEARPNGMDVTDAPPSSGNGASLFVPMFAPDDFNTSSHVSGSTTPRNGYNNWWPDYETGTTYRAAGYWASVTDPLQITTTNETSSTWIAGTSRPREVNVAKYFVNKPYISGAGANSTYNRTAQYDYFRDESGPNHSCTTNAITPLTGSKSTLTNAIDAMAPNGNTNVPEGLAWGWRTVSSGAPFTQGVTESRKDIDKVVIVLTDGANTYATLGTGNNGDMAANKTTFATYGKTGYAGNSGTNGTATPSTTTNVARMFDGTTASKTTHSDANFQVAMDDKMIATCNNIKGQDIILMTVALDLNPANYASADRPAVNKAIQTLTNCAGYSRTRKNSDGSVAKLFWNATSDNLDSTFKEIADELSNLRFTN